MKYAFIPVVSKIKTTDFTEIFDFRAIGEIRGAEA
jgi:hypothetical protein